MESPNDLPKTFIAESEAMKQMVATALKVATNVKANIVLLLGPTGSGKNQLVKLIHRTSPQAQKPLIPVNCAAIPAELREAELFGFCKGAFTGALNSRECYFKLAEGGFIFLNEINETDKNFQRKLLGVFDDWEIWPIGSSKPVKLNIRIIVGASKDPWEMVKSGNFLDAMYYRIFPITIKIPPLCQRIEDIPALVRHFIEKYSLMRMIEISQEALSYLEAYSWPGNVRELEGEIQRIVILNEGLMIIKPEHLSERIWKGVTLKTAQEVSMGLEKERIVQALKAANGIISRASRILGIPRSTLQSKIKNLGLMNFHQN
jgi:transcriptional regulator with PAS, ATPase and Fis domain